jgi:hypothetical protein
MFINHGRLLLAALFRAEDLIGPMRPARTNSGWRMASLPAAKSGINAEASMLDRQRQQSSPLPWQRRAATG